MRVPRDSGLGVRPAVMEFLFVSWILCDVCNLMFWDVVDMMGLMYLEMQS